MYVGEYGVRYNTRYGPDFDPEYVDLLQKNGKKGVGSLAVRVINVLLTAHAGYTVLDTCPHGCAVRACNGRYCSGAWSIIHTRSRLQQDGECCTQNSAHHAQQCSTVLVISSVHHHIPEHVRLYRDQ